MSDADLLQFHAFCLTDTGSRLNEYGRALARRVREGDVVLDLGAGSGVLAILACRAGAARVYAVEASDAIRLGERLASTTALADRIEFIQATSSQVTLPARVDVIVGDIHDTFGLQVGGLTAFLDARDRLLTPAGSLIPRSIQLMVAPVEAHDLYRREIDVWATRVEDVDLSPIRPFAVNQVHAARFESRHLLAMPLALSVIDLARARSPYTAGTVTAVAARDGTLHGVCGSFVTTLDDGIVIGNVPGDGGTTNFAQAFFPLHAPVSVREGDLISIGVETRDGHLSRWRVDVARLGEPPYAHFDHSTLEALLLSSSALRKHAHDYRPTLTPRGLMEQALLERFDGRCSAEDLARWLRQRFTELLPSDAEAAAFLKSTIVRCG